MEQIVNLGYTVEAVDVPKNGAIMEAVQIVDGTNCRPVIYTDRIISETETAEQAAEMVVNIYLSNREPDFDASALVKKDFVLDHLRVGLGRSTQDNTIKRSCDLDDRIEEYLYVIVSTEGDHFATTRVKPELLSAVGINAQDAWKAAEQNTFKETEITDILACWQSLDHRCRRKWTGRQCLLSLTASGSRERLRF